MKRNIIVILVLLGLVAYGGYDYFSESPSKKGGILQTEASDAGVEVGIDKGKLAPEISLHDLQGNPVRLSDFRGKTVMINFWATWCPPCRIEMPHMQKFYDDYKAENVVILGVNMTYTEKSKDKIKAYVEGEKLTFPVILDQVGDVMQDYQIIAYPTTYLVDAQGIVREKFRGAINYEIMEDAVTTIKK
ncbi:TlpA disulfide reductase family protein [Cohnella abietis]|uniref:Thiol:disulfide interchange protein tlpA n=1 Tax=Cohnella abietis TaxID=2507935 RepID=A0A3T1D6Z4_9BACL|nr:TlpA disulfide reductase family protein [Cohnella abietis]BBI33843.1 thiol:disulfide interchange protein tlpA [Cohnella abietis]